LESLTAKALGDQTICRNRKAKPVSGGNSNHVAQTSRRNRWVPPITSPSDDRAIAL
jgi:hypothetical protein